MVILLGEVIEGGGGGKKKSHWCRCEYTSDISISYLLQLQMVMSLVCPEAICEFLSMCYYLISLSCHGKRLDVGNATSSTPVHVHQCMLCM